MNKAFLKAMRDIKKQNDNKQTIKQDKSAQKPAQSDDISSSQQQRLKTLGVHKKKIQKNTEHRDDKWKHDRFKNENAIEKKPKPAPHIQPLALTFTNNPGYNKIYPLIKHLKIYVREISDSKVVFNTITAYEQAKTIYKQNGLNFQFSKDDQKKL